MSSRAGTLRRGSRPPIVAVVAMGVVLALIGGTLASLSSGSTSTTDEPPAVEDEQNRSVPGGDFEVLRGTTGSPALDEAIDSLVASERYRFRLVMSGTGAEKGGFRVTGEADLSANSSDAPRLHAQIAIGSGKAYTVISDQVRVGSEMFVLDPQTGRYVPQQDATDRMIDVDPVSSMLESVFGLAEHSFRQRTKGSLEIVSATGRASGESVRVGIDRHGTIRHIDLASRKIHSHLVLMDVGDPGIAIPTPAR